MVVLRVHLACCKGACVQMFAFFLFSSRPPPPYTTPNIFGRSGFELSSPFLAVYRTFNSKQMGATLNKQDFLVLLT